MHGSSNFRDLHEFSIFCFLLKDGQVEKARRRVRRDRQHITLPLNYLEHALLQRATVATAHRCVCSHQQKPRRHNGLGVSRRPRDKRSRSSKKILSDLKKICKSQCKCAAANTQKLYTVQKSRRRDMWTRFLPTRCTNLQYVSHTSTYKTDKHARV